MIRKPEPASAVSLPETNNSIKTRLITSIIGVSVFLITCFGGPIPWLIAVTIATGMCTYEFVSAYHSRPCPEEESLFYLMHGHPEKNTEPTLPKDLWLNPAFAVAGVLCPLLTYLSLVTDVMAGLGRWAGWPGALLMASLVLIFAIRVGRAAHNGKALSRMRSFYGIVCMGYIGGLFSSFVLIRGLRGHILTAPFGVGDQGAWIMLFAAVCVWATDTFAYFAGRSFGKRKLAPTLSPGKTIEGAIGGLAGAMATGILFAAWIHFPLGHGLVIGAIAGSMGQLGDLFESALKREIGVKDFGRILVGHGGMLDRFDSMLFVAPLVYLYLRLIAI